MSLIRRASPLTALLLTLAAAAPALTPAVLTEARARRERALADDTA